MRRNIFSKLTAVTLSVLLAVSILPTNVFAEISEASSDELYGSDNIAQINPSMIEAEEIPRIDLTDELESEEIEQLDEPEVIIDPLTEETSEVPVINSEENDLFEVPTVSDEKN